MNRYETVFHIINAGEDEFDAGERAGDLIISSEVENGIVLSCEPTHLLKGEEYRTPGVKEQEGIMTFETVIHVINDGEDEFEAGERAGCLFDVSRMENGMIISCEPTYPVMIPTRELMCHISE